MKVRTLSTTMSLVIGQHKNSIPMVGWANPYGSFSYRGKDYEVSIAGGIRAVVIRQTKPKLDDIRYYAIEISDLVDAAMPEILKEEKLLKKEKKESKR
jgi:hypothetical protein